MSVAAAGFAVPQGVEGSLHFPPAFLLLSSFPPCPARQVGIQEELDLKGIAHIGGPADAGKKVELTPGMLLEQDKDVSGARMGAP